MNKNARIFVAGHNGMLGSAILRALQSNGFNRILTANRSELDLCDINQVKLFIEKNKPEFVIAAAAKVGGINANISYPVEFLQDNLLIEEMGDQHKASSVETPLRAGQNEQMYLRSM